MRRLVILFDILSMLALAQPRLVILLCYDQVRGDRIEAMRPWLGERGFLRLVRDGIVAERCLFDYATTVTAAGHATIATGCNPSRHGIVDNDFVIGGRALYATDDTVLGVPSPRLLLMPTLGDYLRRANPQSKVWSFSHKDRGAIFLGGHQPNGAYWLQPHIGLGSSRYYPPPPNWLVRYNRDYSPCRYAGAVWAKKLLSAAPADSVPWEGRFPGGERYFPHRLSADTTSDTFWRAFALTPFSVEWLFGAAIECIRAEQLGVDDVPDLLCISVSSTDFVGHLFGHDSREYAELFVECDRILANFLDTLDRWIGREQYLVVLTSDHGAASIPEFQRERGIDAGRILTDTLKQWIAQWCTAEGISGEMASHLVQYFFPPWLWLDAGAIAGNGWDKEMIATAIAQWLQRQRGIALAMSRGQIEAGSDTGVVGLIRRSYRPDRCGDIVLYPQPQWIFGTTPAQHGTPYDYDRWVPLVFYGMNLPHRSISELCSPTDIVPAVAALLSLPPVATDGRALLHRPMHRKK